MHKIVIAGRTESGKTTLFEGLKQHYPQALFVPDPIRGVMLSEQQRATAEMGYTAKTKENNAGIFGKLIIARALRDKQSIPKDIFMTIQDTSLLDVIPFAKDNHCEYLLQRIKPLIPSAKYSLALDCDALDREKDKETFYKTCEEYAIKVVSLEIMEPDKRLFLAKQAIDSYIGL